MRYQNEGCLFCGGDVSGRKIGKAARRVVRYRGVALLKFVAAAYTLANEGKEMVWKPAAVTADDEFGEDIHICMK